MNIPCGCEFAEVRMCEVFESCYVLTAQGCCEKKLSLACCFVPEKRKSVQHKLHTFSNYVIGPCSKIWDSPETDSNQCDIICESVFNYVDL